MAIYLVLPLILVTFIAFVLVMFFLMTRFKRLMLCVCVGFVTVGFMIYTAGHLSAGEGPVNALFAALRGIFSTARMFSLNDDFVVLANAQGTQWLTENIYLKILLWTCHISALIIIQTALISLFGRRLVDRFRLRLGFHREVYIIKGNDKNALILGENIATRDNPKGPVDPKRLIVFLIEEEDDAEKFRKKVSHFDGVVRVLDRNHDIKYHLKTARLGKRNWLWMPKKYKVILMPENTKSSSPDDAQRIAAFANDKGVPHDALDIFVFVSSEWDREKIEKITQAKNGVQRKYQYTFHIISEIDLLIRQMIEKHPPFACSGLNFSNGKAERGFTALIVGFGIVGQSALLRLIMNGQFVGGKMRAIIVDKKISDLQDWFLHRYPSLNLCCDMDFRNYDVQCDKFFSLLNETENVDYVVVALNSDELNKRTTQDIELHYERKGVEHLPFIAVSEKGGSLHEEDETENPFIFGSREEIYKDSVIIREENDRMAKAVNETYKKLYGGRPWHELDWFLQESNRAVADFIPAMLFLAKLKKDAPSKDSLTTDSNLAETLAQTEHLRWNAFHAAMGYRPISIEEMRRRFEKNKNLDFARRDAKARLQVCLVSWDELDEVSEAYRELERLAGKEPKRDFKNNDRGIVENIPMFLQEAVTNQ